VSTPTHPLPDVLGAIRGGAGNTTLEAVITIDEDQRVVMANPAALRMFGCDAATALGSDLSRFIPARFHATHAKQVRDFGASGVSESPMGKRGVICGRRANGEEFPLEASIARVDVPGPNGTRHLFTALLRDLSELQALKGEIDALNAHVRGIFELAPIAIWVTHHDRIVFCNRACANLFAAPGPETLIGKPIYALLAHESHARVRKMMAQALTVGTPLPRIKERIARLDGTVREVEIAAAELPDRGGTVLQMVITDITEQHRESRELERSRSELRQLSANLVNAREEERRRIARELHDELGQQLTALKMELTSLAAQPLPAGPHQRIAALCGMVDQTVASVRRIATDLRPLMLDDLGLIAAIEWLARESARRLGIDITLSLGDADPPISDAATIALYRMVQEALTNVARHANASRASIELRCSAASLTLTVQDNGVGIPQGSRFREGSHGLMGIRERAHMLGGTLKLDEAPGGGCRITIHLPLSPADPLAPMTLGASNTRTAPRTAPRATPRATPRAATRAADKRG
jgi:two-component system, NarL family, sensor histidine kinase UhpB